MECAIQTDGMGYCYPGSSRWVFNDLNLSIEPGAVIRITGRNGTGKSTLLKLLAVQLEPTCGARRSRPGTHVLYMNQDAGSSLATDLTLREHLLATLASTSSLGQSEQLLQDFDVGLHERMDEFVGHLSGGQRQIVALACAILCGANVLCLDEFTSSLDESSALAAYRAICRVNQALGTTLVLATHSAEHLKLMHLPIREIHLPVGERKPGS